MQSGGERGECTGVQVVPQACEMTASAAHLLVLGQILQQAGSVHGDRGTLLVAGLDGLGKREELSARVLVESVW
jgi:hypothetical protein